MTHEEPVPPASAPAELVNSGVRFRQEGGFSPLQWAEYAVVVRAGTPVAYQTKYAAGYDEPLQRMALMTWDEYAALWAELPASLDAAPPNAPDSAEKHPNAHGGPARPPVYSLVMTRGDVTVERHWGEDAPVGPSTAYVDAIKRAVRARMGDIPLRSAFVDRSKRGWVDVRTVPSARVYIDGRDTQERTPLETYEVASGDHKLRVVNEERGVDETYDFRVEPGVTTILDLDLR